MTDQAGSVVYYYPEGGDFAATAAAPLTRTGQPWWPAIITRRRETPDHVDLLLFDTKGVVPRHDVPMAETYKAEPGRWSAWKP
jgi:hypothetical protein